MAIVLPRATLPVIVMLLATLPIAIALMRPGEPDDAEEFDWLSLAKARRLA